KNLGALGDGGAVCTGDADVAARGRAPRNPGQQRQGEHALLGDNQRPDALPAGPFGVQPPRLPAPRPARPPRAAGPRAGLGDGIRILEETAESPGIYHLFPIRVPARDDVAASLAEAGIQTGVHYSPAMPAHEALAGCARTPEPVPEAEAWAAEELSLP